MKSNHSTTDTNQVTITNVSEKLGNGKTKSKE